MRDEKAGTLLAATLSLLRSDKRSLIEIHKATELPYHWLRQMREGRTPDPGVNRVQALYEYLTGSTLF